jgi:hypothetical protein
MSPLTVFKIEWHNGVGWQQRRCNRRHRRERERERKRKREREREREREGGREKRKREIGRGLMGRKGGILRACLQATRKQETRTTAAKAKITIYTISP